MNSYMKKWRCMNDAWENEQAIHVIIREWMKLELLGIPGVLILLWFIVMRVQRVVQIIRVQLWASSYDVSFIRVQTLFIKRASLIRSLSRGWPTRIFVNGLYNKHKNEPAYMAILIRYYSNWVVLITLVHNINDCDDTSDPPITIWS